MKANKQTQPVSDQVVTDPDKLYQKLYPEIKKIACLQIARLRPGQTITPTVLSHECFIKLASHQSTEFINDKHFFCTVAKCMRNYLIDVIRHKNRAKNVIEFDGINSALIPDNNNIDQQLLEMNQMIDQLAAIDQKLAELTELRFFGGFSLVEIAEFQGLSKRQIVRQWNMAKSFFITLLSEQSMA